MSYSKIYNYDDFLSFLSDSGYASAAKKQKDALDESLKLELNQLENRKKDINKESDELARQAYISYLSASKGLPEKLDAAGLNGGAADNVYLSLANEYQNNYNDIGRDRQERLDETESKMIEAKQSSNKEYSSALSKIYGSAVDSFLESRENEEDRNLDKYKTDKTTEESSAKRKFELAKFAFELGDPTLLESMGVKIPTASGGTDGAGITAGKTPAELMKTFEYAVELAKYGNYTLYCDIMGVTKEEAALTFTDDSVPYTESQIRDAAKLFMGGDYSESVFEVLRAAYPDYTFPQIWQLWKLVAETEWMMRLGDTYTGPK